MRDVETASKPPRRVRLLAVAIVAALAGAGAAALLVNIFEHKQEAKNPFFRVVELDDETDDPAIWGKNFPLQYDGYRRTVDQKRTRFGGSEAVPRTPTDADPRSVVAQSRLEEDPRLKTMWAGYAFAVDFREERGHAYMLDDQTFTERQHVAKQPGTCLHCHASVYVPYRKLGDGDLIRGFEAMNRMPYAEARKLVAHPVACIDCHDPQTMQLRVTRPGFLEGIRALKAAAGRGRLRREPRRDAPGDAHVRLRAVPRRVLLPGRGEAARLPVGEGPAGRADPGLLRRGRAQGLDPRRDRRAGAQGAAPGVRDVEPGHPRPLGRGLRRLPHAVPARRRAEDQRPPRAEPAAQRQRAPARPATAGPRRSCWRGSRRSRSARSGCATRRWTRSSP